MKIALIKETKTPVDNRVALAPKQVAELNKQYPQHQIVVQASDIRAFSEEEYRAEGVEVVNDVSDADILFGIKEAKIESLIPSKHYFFFGHLNGTDSIQHMLRSLRYTAGTSNHQFHLWQFYALQSIKQLLKSKTAVRLWKFIQFMLQTIAT